MIRSTLLGGIVLVAVLPMVGGAAGAARADGFEPPIVAYPPRPVAHRPARAGDEMRTRGVGRRWADHGARRRYDGSPGETGLVYGWPRRNLNLPIYNAPSDGPAPTL